MFIVEIPFPNHPEREKDMSIISVDETPVLIKLIF